MGFGMGMGMHGMHMPSMGMHGMQMPMHVGMGMHMPRQISPPERPDPEYAAFLRFKELSMSKTHAEMTEDD